MEEATTFLDTEAMPWEPWDRYFPGAPPNRAPAGAWCKVLRHHPETGRFVCLLRVVPPPGRLVRIVARTRSTEEALTLSGRVYDARGRPASRKGEYVRRPPGSFHSAYYGEEVIALVAYDGEPEEILAFEEVAPEPA